MNLLGHGKFQSKEADTRSRATNGPPGPGAGAPQVTLEQALTSAFRLYAAQAGTRPLSDDELRTLLGHDRTSGASVRLTVGLQGYGLVERRQGRYALSGEARHLFETEDYQAFKTGLTRAATRPELMHDLLSRYGGALDSRELEDELKGRRLPEGERRTLLAVLRDNRELLTQDVRSAQVFVQLRRGDAGPLHPTRAGGLAGSADWLRSLPGRTANLALVAVCFAASLAAVALHPGDLHPGKSPGTAPEVSRSEAAKPDSARRPRQVTAPVPEVRLPAAETAPVAGRRRSPVTAQAVATQAGAAQSGTAQARTDHAGSGRSGSGGVAPATAAAPPTTFGGTADLAARLPGTATSGSADHGSSDHALAAQTAVAQTGAAPGASGRAQRQAAGQVAQTSASGAPRDRTTRQENATLPATGEAQATGPATVAGPSDAATPPDTASDPLAPGRRLADLFYRQRLHRFWNLFSPEVQREWGSYGAFRDDRLKGLEAFGAELKVVSEEVRVGGGVTYYVRTATFERGPRQDWSLIIGMNAAGQIVAFNIVAADVLPGITALAAPVR